MKQKILVGLAFISALAGEDRVAVPGPNGIAFSEFKGYEAWQAVAPSVTGDGLMMITGNAVLIKAYQEGIPENGKPVPDGAMFAKIGWTTKKDPESPYPAQVPDTLKRIGFMIKDSKRFPETDGWGYAQWLYDAASNSFKPEYADKSFGKKLCHQCHTIVKGKDFVFTMFPVR
jgi:hypothetical protein